MTTIEWADKTWNCLVGCSKVSKGCASCYAMGDAPHRFPGVYEREGVVKIGTNPKRPGLTFVPSLRVLSSRRQGRAILKRHDDETITVSLGKGPQWTGEVRLLPWKLDEPLRRRKPTKWFVNSLADIFHEKLVGCDEGRWFIAAIFGVMAACPQHIFQTLTKRDPRPWFRWLAGEAERAGLEPIEVCILAAIDALRSADPETEGGALWRAADLLMDRWLWASMGDYGFEALDDLDAKDIARRIKRAKADHADDIDAEAWPLPNVWVGQSVEDQAAADERIPWLLGTPAAVHWLSIEPALGAVVLPADFLALGSRAWVVCGGESGSKARPMHPDWARSLRDQCVAAGVAYLYKQSGAWAEVASDDPTWTHMVALDGRLFDRGEEVQISTMTSVSYIKRVGKKAAGRWLDGRTWDEYPELAGMRRDFRRSGRPCAMSPTSSAS